MARPWFPDAFLSPGRSGIKEQRHKGPAVRAGPGLQGAESPPTPPSPGSPLILTLVPHPPGGSSHPQIRVLTQSEAICARPGVTEPVCGVESLLVPPSAQPA